MGFENMQTPQENTDENEIKKRALILEEKNTEVEEMPQGPERDARIAELDALNEELARLEELSGIPEDEIMEEYKNLTQEMAQKNIEQLLEALRATSSEEEIAEMEKEISDGTFSKVLEAAKKFIPDRKTLAAFTASLLLFGATMSINISNAYGGDNHKSTHIEQTINTSQQEQSEMTEEEITKEVKKIIGEANKNAGDVIKNAKGFIKALAQKRIVDNLAMYSNDILDYISGEITTPPPLEGEAMQIFDIYAEAIKKADETNNTEIKSRIRDLISQNVKLVATKNYSDIKAKLMPKKETKLAAKENS